jgi:hydrogenase maturation protease
MEDEGVGVFFVRFLKDLLNNFEVLEVGNLSLSLLEELKERELLIFVDSLVPDYPEDYLWFELKGGTIPIRNSLHELSIRELVGVMELMGSAPNYVFIFGIKPFSIRPKIGLSQMMEEKLSQLKTIFMEKIKELEGKYPSIYSKPNLDSGKL